MLFNKTKYSQKPFVKTDLNFPSHYEGNEICILKLSFSLALSHCDNLKPGPRTKAMVGSQHTEPIKGILAKYKI